MVVAVAITEVGLVLIGQKEGRNVLVHSSSMAIKCIVPRPKVEENSGTVGNGLGG
jgi:hypothetical protein